MKTSKEFKSIDNFVDQKIDCALNVTGGRFTVCSDGSTNLGRPGENTNVVIDDFSAD